MWFWWPAKSQNPIALQLCLYSNAYEDYGPSSILQKCVMLSPIHEAVGQTCQSLNLCIPTALDSFITLNPWSIGTSITHFTVLTFHVESHNMELSSNISEWRCRDVRRVPALYEFQSSPLLELSQVSMDQFFLKAQIFSQTLEQQLAQAYS